jgi:hypothetical protein
VLFRNGDANSNNCLYHTYCLTDAQRVWVAQRNLDDLGSTASQYNEFKAAVAELSNSVQALLDSSAGLRCRDQKSVIYHSLAVSFAQALSDFDGLGWTGTAPQYKAAAQKLAKHARLLSDPLAFPAHDAE